MSPYSHVRPLWHRLAIIAGAFHVSAFHQNTFEPENNPDCTVDDLAPLDT